MTLTHPTFVLIDHFVNSKIPVFKIIYFVDILIFSWLDNLAFLWKEVQYVLKLFIKLPFIIFLNKVEKSANLTIICPLSEKSFNCCNLSGIVELFTVVLYVQIMPLVDLFYFKPFDCMECSHLMKIINAAHICNDNYYYS